MSAASTTVAIQDLLDRLAQGDEAAQELLVTQAMEKLGVIARKLLRGFGGEARVEMWTLDVVHEAFPKISKAIHDVKPKSVDQFLGLARLQMQRILLDKVRTLNSRPPVGSVQPNEIAGKESGEHQTLLLDLLDSIAQLPERQAETVWLKLAGHTHREIGAFLKIHHDTVDTYWAAACVKLARKLAPFINPAVTTTEQGVDP